MKKIFLRIAVLFIFTIVFIPSLIFAVFSCVPHIKIIDPYIPAGYISTEEHWDKEGFQDFTDFCVYHYAVMPPQDSMADYRVTESEAELDELAGYFSNFRSWMDTEKRLDEYTFDDSCISPGDLYYFKTKQIGSYDIFGSYSIYVNYSLYFFDLESLTLYYIHNNI